MPENVFDQATVIEQRKVEALEKIAETFGAHAERASANPGSADGKLPQRPAVS
jgi:hypothetical protein